MNNMSNRFTATSTDPKYAIALDRETCIAMTEEFKVPTLAMTLPQFDLGVFVTLDKTAGVYGTDVNKKAILSKYWDRNSESIEEMIVSASSVEEILGMAACVLLHFIDEMDDNTLNYLQMKAS